MAPRFLELCVFLSGGVALVLEAVFQRYLTTLIGATTPAAAIVLAIYFAGLTLGALIAPKGRRGAGTRLALLELFIAAWSGVLALLFYPSYDFFARLLPPAEAAPPLQLHLARAAIAIFWILPPTTAMGAHLPTLRALLEERGWSSPGRLTRLYALNLVGAFLFTLAAPFALFTLLGLQGALLCTAALGLAVAAGLWAAFGRDRAGSSAATATPPPTAAVVGPPPRVPPLAWALALGSGFTLFALEVIWNHLIAAALGASTFSFSILLAAVLFALALGGSWVERAAPANEDEARALLSRSLGLMAIALPLTSVLWPHVGHTLANVAGGFHSFWAAEALKLVFAAVLVVPVAATGGTLFPLTFHLLGQSRAPGAPEIGRLYAVNAFGCAVGALFGSYLLVPRLGAERTFALVLGLVVAAALVLSAPWRKRGPLRLGKLLPVALGALAAMLLPAWDLSELTGGYSIYMRPHILPGSRLVFLEETSEVGFATVRELPAENIPLGRPTTVALYSNGKFDADDFLELGSQSALGLLPALFAARQDRALVIGLGSGHTVATALASGYQEVDVCEISPSHVRAARQFFGHLNRGALDRPEVRIFLEDGRNYLLRSTRRYDLISIELTSVWFAGAANLYSSEFYQHARRRLRPGGVLVQFIQLHHLTPSEIATAVATLAGELPHVEVFRTQGLAIMVASMESLELRKRTWERFEGSAELSLERKAFADLAGGSSLKAIEGLRVLDEEGVREFLRQTPHAINTDRNKWLEFHTPRYYLSRADHVRENLAYLGSFQPAAPPRDGAVVLDQKER